MLKFEVVAQHDGSYGLVVQCDRVSIIRCDWRFLSGLSTVPLSLYIFQTVKFDQRPSIHCRGRLINGGGRKVHPAP